MENRLLSFSEERMWVLAGEREGSSAFVECPIHVPSVSRLIGPLDHQALVASINEIIRRHEVLRSTFVRLKGKPKRVVTPFTKMAVPLTILSLPIAVDRDEVIRQTLAEIVCRPFDLARGPLIRAQILKLGDEEHVLAIIVHHIVFDGWSLQILWRELAALYEAYVGGHPSPLPELKMTYAGYVDWQRARIEGDRFRTLMDYWTNQLRDVPELLVPSDNPRTVHTSNRSARERFAISSQSAERIQKLSQECGITSGVLLATIFKVLLHKLTGATDVAIGLPIADRNRPEFEPLVGLFLNLLALRTDLSQDPTFLDLCEQVHRTFIEAYNHRDLPYGFLLNSHGFREELDFAPLRVVFNFVIARQAAPSLSGLTIERVEIEGDPPSFADLSLHIFDRGGAINGFILYKTDLYSSTRIREIVFLLIRLLSDVLEAPRRRISGYVPRFV